MFNLNRIIAGSLRGRLVVAAVAIVVSAVGIAIALSLPVDVLPDLNRPTVTILSEAHGLVPEDVERLVTRPLEQALNGATGVARVRSSSGLGLSVVWIEFGWDTDIFRDRQVVQEKLALAAPHLPPGAQPSMAPVASIMGQVLQVGLKSRSGATHAERLREIADVEVWPRLRSLEGVAQVVLVGGRPKQLQVVADLAAMRAHDVSLEEVEAAIRASNTFGTGGVLPMGPEGPLVAVTGLLRGEQDLRSAVV